RPERELAPPGGLEPQRRRDDRVAHAAYRATHDSAAWRPDLTRAYRLSLLSIVVVIDYRYGGSEMTMNNERRELTEPLGSVTRFFGALMIIAALVGTA